MQNGGIAYSTKVVDVFKTDSQITEMDRCMENSDHILPPPPDGFYEPSEHPGQITTTASVTSTIPNGPARPWGSISSDEDSEPEVDDRNIKMKRLDEEGSESSGTELYETESECITEIFIPKNQLHSGSSVAVRKRHSDVIPSVSSENINHRASLHGHQSKISSVLTSEEISTNIDSGISNETSNLHSNEGTVVVVATRPISVSSSSHYSSSYSCGSRGDIPSPNLGVNCKNEEVASYMKEAKLSRVGNLLSLAYGCVLLILTALFSILDLMNQNEELKFKGFFIYLYGVSVLFLIYIYARALRGTELLSRQRSHHSEQLTYYGIVNGKDHTTPMVGSLFIRITAVLFCVGSIIDNGLKFGTHLADNCPSHLLLTLQPVGQVVVMFLEIYFIFNNSQMMIRRNPVLCKFGIIHLLVTNLGILASNMLTEIRNLGLRSEEVAPFNKTYTDITREALLALNHNPGEYHNCTHSEIMYNMALRAKPYTYPCTIQFGILTTCMLYALWKIIDGDEGSQCSDCREHDKQMRSSPTRTIDCSHTSIGMLTGIAVFVCAIACLIVFFILVSTNFHDTRATLLIHIYQIAMYFIMAVIAVVILLKLTALDYNQCRSTRLEDLLLGVSLIALFAYDLLGIFSGILSINKLKGLLVLSTCMAELLQSVIQMAAIVMSMKLCVNDSVRPSKRPGKQFVTFMIVANLSLWITSIFTEVIGQRYIVSIDGVGTVSWNTVNNIAGPFVMFYHLFSASCFVDIWYNSYKVSQPIVEV